MLTHPTLEKLREMKLFGMAKALQEQLELNNAGDLCFEEWSGEALWSGEAFIQSPPLVE